MDTTTTSTGNGPAQRRCSGGCGHAHGGGPAPEPDFLQQAHEAGVFAERPTPRSTAAETAYRVAAVAGWITQGFSRARMLQSASTKWNISVRSLDGYVSKAFCALAKELARERAGQVEILKRRNDYHYRRAVELDNLREIGASIDARAKLLGLNSPEKRIMQLSGPDGAPVEMAVLDMPEKKWPVED